MSRGDETRAVLVEYRKLPSADRRAVLRQLSTEERHLLQRLVDRPSKAPTPSSAGLSAYSHGLRRALKKAIAVEGTGGTRSVTPATRQLLRSILSHAESSTSVSGSTHR